MGSLGGGQFGSVFGVLRRGPVRVSLWGRGGGQFGSVFGVLRRGPGPERYDPSKKGGGQDPRDTTPAKKGGGQDPRDTTPAKKRGGQSMGPVRGPVGTSSGPVHRETRGRPPGSHRGHNGPVRGKPSGATARERQEGEGKSCERFLRTSLAPPWFLL